MNQDAVTVQLTNAEPPAATERLVDPSSTQARPAASLPVPLTDYVERPHVLKTVRDLLGTAGVRLVTLTGPGGAGKTRLALRLAEELAPTFGADVRFAPLASVADPALIPAAIALALDLQLSDDERLGARLNAVLGQDRLLLVLDNFEHVLPAAPIVSEVLQACLGLTVLVTSRAPLRLAGEHVFPVAGMRIPDPLATSITEVLQAEAVQLFVARAVEASGAFAVTDDHADDVAAICRRLDGLPLAIELAAARVGALPPQTLRARLDHSLSLLTSGPRDAPDRLQTMRAAIAWSHQLLSPSEQVLFRRLGVFEGGCTLEAAEAMAGEGLELIDGLAALVAGSLVQCHDVPGDEPRYLMLETVRHFALEQLAASGEEASTRDAHAAWCLALAERAWSSRDWRATTPRWLSWFNRERDNLRAALTWLTRDGATEPGLRLISLLWLWWFYSGSWQEGMDWVERALAWTAGERTRLRFELVHGAANLLRPASPEDLGRAVAWAEEAVAIARELHDGEAEVRALIALGIAELEGGDYGAAASGQLHHARAMLEAALALARNLAGDQDDVQVTVIHRLSLIALWLGEDAEAERRGNEALMLARRLGRKATEAAVCNALAVGAYRRGDRDRATRYCLDSLTILADLPHVMLAMYDLDRLAIIAGEDPGQAGLAATLGGAVERLHAALGSRPNPDEQADRDRAREAARARLGDAAFAAAWEAGRSKPLGEAIALGLTVTPPASSRAHCQPSHVVAGKAGITLRELDVLRLIASGRTDQEIADALFLSRRTVNAHVAHILAKLDVATRREAVARGRELGLLTAGSAGDRYT